MLTDKPPIVCKIIDYEHYLTGLDGAHSTQPSVTHMFNVYQVSAFEFKKGNSVFTCFSR